MHIIRTAWDLARALDSPLDPELRTILQSHADRLAAYADFAFEELATILVLEVGECLTEAYPVSVGAGGRDFSHSPEYVRFHVGWIEAVFVFSDDGFGLILLVEQGQNADPDLIAACEAEAH
jgi:hypothetical protein